MDCNQLNTHLDDYIDHSLDEKVDQAISVHVSQCSACQSVIAKEQELRDMLRQLPVPQPSAGFAERAMRIAVERNSHHHHRAGFIKGFGAAIAAGLMLWIVIGVLPVSRQMTAPDPGHQISIALYGTQNVKLAFHAVSELKDAKITIQLPDNLALTGYEGRRELVWHTHLKQGDNILTLPIRAEAIAKGRIRAKVEHDNQIKTIEIAVDVKEGGMTMEPLQMNSV